jgi:glycosyltransferase involved in cell wall biosynthesis
MPDAEYPLHKPRAITPGAGFFLRRLVLHLAHMPPHPTRVLVFTDTLADINGVCRFIQNIAQSAHDTDHALLVYTSTRLEMPAVDNVVNFTPAMAMKMPKYDTLDLAIPPMIAMLRAADEFRPDVIHISTPGPVGIVGMLAAKLMRVPVVGVYHTDFPAYIDELFDNRFCSWFCRSQMSIFYKQFRAVFSRSADYADRLVELGIDRSRLVWLKPGFDNTRFDPTLRNPSIWDRFGVQRDSIKAIYCGRISTEKNLPILVEIWPEIRRRVNEAGRAIELIIIGDGPYRNDMEHALADHGAHFLGFRHGTELATLYSSSDLFIFPSTTDTLGQVVMESQASGLPVIVTDQGGPKEIVDDQTTNAPTAFVLPINDTEQWIKTIAELATNDRLRNAMGNAGIEAMKSYTFAESFTHYWQVHEEAK